MALRSEGELLERLRSGRLIEGPDTATEAYVEGLKRTLIVSADTELISAPAYLRAARDAPSINSYMSATSIVQDELGHAHIGYRMLRDLGVDTDQLIYEREPKAFKYPYAFDVPLDRWEELVIANAFYDRAGFVLLSDIFQHTSYGPWKRALVKAELAHLWPEYGGLHFHDLRHTHATWLIAQRVPMIAVAGRLGHANAVVTMMVYAHVDTLVDRGLLTVDELGLAAPTPAAVVELPPRAG